MQMLFRFPEGIGRGGKSSHIRFRDESPTVHDQNKHFWHSLDFFSLQIFKLNGGAFEVVT